MDDRYAVSRRTRAIASHGARSQAGQVMRLPSQAMGAGIGVVTESSSRDGSRLLESSRSHRGWSDHVGGPRICMTRRRSYGRAPGEA